MAAPSSAQTSPSQSAKSAPHIHPSMACGPPAALIIRGMVMKGPTPIMSIMFSVVACNRPTPRISSGFAAASSGSMSHAQQVDVEANRARHSEGKLPEERIAGVDVVALAVLCQQQSAFLRLLAGIIGGQQRGVLGIERLHEVEAALLHPTGEIALRNLVRVVEDFVFRLKQRDRSIFH